jgi:hypothetical protein
MAIAPVDADLMFMKWAGARLTDSELRIECQPERSGSRSDRQNRKLTHLSVHLGPVFFPNVLALALTRGGEWQVADARLSVT